MSSSKLFQPITLGDVVLKHRVALAPLTRVRADANNVPLPIVKEMYVQRASTPGTLLITEATFIAACAGGYTNVPGIWSDEQIAAWKEITDAVHAKGSFIYLQLWALGRSAIQSVLHSRDPSHDVVSASDIPLSDRKDGPLPRPLTIPEIKEYVSLYAIAASNAVHKAGFDGVEIHNANGYLLDQFTQDMSNNRTDEYGGSVENRARFSLEVVDAVVKAVGPRKTAIRFSPWNTYQDMRMADPKPTFSYLISEIKKAHPTLSYVHVVEPRVRGDDILDVVPEVESNDFIREIWIGSEKFSDSDPNARRLISAGGYTRALATEAADQRGEIIAFGRHFIANPDLPYRLQHDISLNKYDRSTFHVQGSSEPKGFTDYPFVENV
ncbi:hypothetical protein VKT23_012508 [Stygiomarasmius scandens]|uniref:NADH:flavin oxidoreductase/NADH oxidase N-terminal domain-containing protein n=1 Tax=Marasmiellus scandens TaxID=2682957 RepID=A0ABR1JAS5_9AGAR